MASVTLFFFILVYIQKKKTIVTNNSMNFWGIYILASVQTKLCIPKKQNKTKKKKKLEASALAQKQPHRKLCVGGGGETMSFPGHGPRPVP